VSIDDEVPGAIFEIGFGSATRVWNLKPLGSAGSQPGLGDREHLEIKVDELDSGDGVMQPRTREVGAA
jgi:hypothetical protein